MSYNPVNDSNIQEKPITRAGCVGQSITWFNDYFPNDPGVYVYNDQGGQGIEDGRVNVSGTLNQKTIQVFISAIDSTSLTIRIEGRLNQEDVWGEIYTEVFIVPTSVALLWPICEYVSQIRVGILKTGSGTLDRVSISGDFITWKGSFQ